MISDKSLYIGYNPYDGGNMKSGIYCIRNVHCSKDYIGSSIDVPNRWYAHRYALRKGSHTNHHLQNAWNKHGEASFEFSVLEYCDPTQLKEREAWWMSLLQTRNPVFGYNKWAADRHEASPETCLKISESHKRSGIRPPVVDWTGKKHRESSKVLMSVAKLGKTSWNKGVRASDNSRRKMSLAKIGKSSPRKGSPISAETRARISESTRGKNAKTYELTTPSGETMVICNLHQFCKDHSLWSSNMVKVSKGKQSSHKGWKVRTLDL